MKILIQRVSRASVKVGGAVVGKIGPGLLAFICIVKGDTKKEATFLAEKVSGLRVFEDAEGKMNLSVRETKGSILVVSQFTLAADCRRGRRPGFEMAALPDEAQLLCDFFVNELRGYGVPVETGRFAADMNVELVNSGPVTIMLDS